MLGVLTRQLYVLAVGGGLIAFQAGSAFGWPLEGVVLGWSAFVLGLGLLLERLVPFDPRWNEPAGDTATDAISAAVLIGLVDPLVKAVFSVLAVSWLARSGGPDAGWILGGMPFAVQLMAVVLWVEFAKYWSHRVHHQVAGLWWLHALHHGSERLYWLNNFRFHPLNHVLNTLVSLLPLMLIGAPREVLLAAVAVTQPVLMLQHANIGVRHGWLNYVFSTHELHRWHHSTEPREANSNFGSALVLWDQVFGTFRAPGDAGRPRQLGLFAGSRYPARATYLQQLASMFRPGCCRA